MRDSNILKQAREESGISQKQLAKNLDISQTQVSRYEKDPESIPAGLFSRWAGMFGLNPADVLREDTGANLKAKPGNPYSEFRTDLDLLSRYIDKQAPDSLRSLAENTGEVAGNLPSADDLKDRLRKLRQKPNVMTAGGFDTGKSYLANTLMGKDVLPTSFQPATSVVTVVRHVEDRPEWQDEDVWLFEESLWEVSGDENVVDVSRLDEKSCADHRILAGSHDLLGKYGVHRSEPTAKVKRRLDRAHSAVVYTDAPILRACNLIDLPGFGDRPGKSTDQRKAESTLPFADVVLYASRIAGHLSGKDLARVSSLLRQIPAPETQDEGFPTLGNLFLVATHADRNLSDDEVTAIREGSTRRLHQHLKDSVLSVYEDRTGRIVEEEDLQRQWFPFWAENERRSRPLVDRLEEILGERLPEARVQQNREALEELKEDLHERCDRGARLHREAAEESAEKKVQVRKLKEKAIERKEALQKKREEVHDLIDSLEKKSRSRVKMLFQQDLSIDDIKELVTRNFDDKNEAKDQAPALVVEKIESETERVIGNLNDELTAKVDEYLDTYKKFSLQVGGSRGLEVPFDARGAFAGGLASVATAGGLTAWASQLGTLGGYAIIAQSVGTLSTLGISISGGAAAVSAWVASMGGPITLGAAVAGVAGLAGWRLLTSSWEERLAKKIKKHYEEEGLRDRFIEGVEEYWEDTREAFEAGADAVDEEFKDHLLRLEELSKDEERARQFAEWFEDARDFYSGMPV